MRSLLVSSLLALLLVASGCPQAPSRSKAEGTPPSTDVAASTEGGASTAGAEGERVQVAHNESRPAQVFAGNLIVNGTADGELELDQAGLTRIPGWDPQGRIGCAGYSANAGAPTLESAGPPARGDRYFAGPATGSGPVADQTIHQLIDVSASAADIDGGKVRWTARGWFGANGDAHARLALTFLDEAGATVGEGATPAVPHAAGSIALAESTAEGAVPARTRKVRVELQPVGASADAETPVEVWADSLELTLTR